MLEFVSISKLFTRLIDVFKMEQVCSMGIPVTLYDENHWLSR